MEYTKNFGFRHKAGVILSVSSLPSSYGIGSFGEEAHKFIDFLDATGQRVWQVLPLNPTSYGDRLIVRIPTITLEDDERKAMVYGSKLHITFEGKVMHFFNKETSVNLLT